MRANRSLIGWGLFFIVFGGMLLGIRQGWIPADLAERAWQLWPVLLVAAGLSLVLAGRSGAWLGGLIAAACLGVVAGGLVATGAGLPLFCSSADDSGTAFETQSGDLSSKARVTIVFRCGDLSARATGGTKWEVIGESADGQPPASDRAPDGLRIEPASSSGLFGFGRKRERWDVTLPADPSIDLDVTLNAGEGRLALAGAHLGTTDAVINAGSLRVDLRDVATATRLDGTVNAGSAVVWLPALSLEGDLTANAGSLTLCAPEGIGLRLITGNNPISSNDFENAGLIRSDDAWETPGFAAAPIRIVMQVTANAGSLSLNPRQACAG